MFVEARAGWDEAMAVLRLDPDGQPMIVISHRFPAHLPAKIRTKREALSVAAWLVEHADALPDGNKDPVHVSVAVAEALAAIPRRK